MDWKNAFSSLVAPSPLDPKTMVSLTIDENVVQQMSREGWNNNLFAMFYNVAGKLPPVNNIGHHEKSESSRFPDHWSGLKNAHALFKGLQRPMNNDGDDEEVYIYVLEPKYVYKYVADMVCMAKRIPAPKNTVFLIYAVFNKDISKGTIVNWEWVPNVSQTPNLPEDFDMRYTTRIW